MPNPKRRHSAQRGAKRRTHYKAFPETWSKDATTGESHLRHRAHWVEGKMYYKGKLVIDNSPATPSAPAEPEEDTNNQ